MSATKTLSEVIELVAKEKLHHYMGGGNQFYVDSNLIAFIYDLEPIEVVKMIKEEFERLRIKATTR